MQRKTLKCFTYLHCEESGAFFNKPQELLYVFSLCMSQDRHFLSPLALLSHVEWPWSSSSSDGQINLVGGWEQHSWLSYSTSF